MPTLLLVAILAFALISFMREWLPIELTALVALAALLLFGLVTPTEAISGLSEPAVVTVLLMFVLSEAAARSGLISRIGHRIAHTAGASSGRANLLLLLTVAVASAFVNNTAAVALLIPITLQLARHYDLAPSRLLLPLSYLAMMGGTCTLIGTSTNLLVSGLGVRHGARPIAMFEPLPLGLLLTAIGLVYVLVARRRLPSGENADELTSKYELGGFLTEMRVPADSLLVGRTVVTERVSERFRLNVLEILRGKVKIAVDIRHTEIAPDDVLIVRGAPADLVHFRDHFGLLMLTDTKLMDADLADDQAVLAEMQVGPAAPFLGRTVKQIDFRRRFGVFVLALARPGEAIREKLAAIPLRAWDTLLVFGPRTRVDALSADEDFLPLEQHDLPLRPRPLSWVPLVIIVMVVTIAATGWVSILEAALIGTVLVLAVGVLPMPLAYKAIDWSVIVLIAALLPLGFAMERTGLSTRLADGLFAAGAALGPWGVLALVYLATALLTELVSNNASVILMVPVALGVAADLGADARPFLMAVAFAGSTSFLTPMGYQTNTMIYGPGGYRFNDYLRFGWPLKLVFWAVTVAAIPRLWPL